MARKVGKAGREGVELEDGSRFTSKELEALSKRHTKKLNSLVKNYSAGVRRKSKTAAAGGAKKAGGFGQAVFLEQPLIDFLSQANLGTLKDGTSVSDEIAPFLEQGVLSRGILTQLMTFYKQNNPQMNFEVKEGDKTYKRLRATKDMERFLGPYLSQLEASDKREPKISKTGKVSPAFDRSNFIYNQLSRVTTLGVKPNDDLDQQEKAYIEDPKVKSALSATEQKFKQGKR